MSILLLALTGLVQQNDDVRLTTRPIRGVVKLENGKPAAGFRVYVAGGWSKKQDAETKTSARGTFTLRISPGVVRPQIFASSPDGELLGSFDPYETARLLRITARPKHTVECMVRDKDGKPLAGADVGLTSRNSMVASARSDQNGKCSIAIPSNVLVEYVYAKKDDHGFDYYEHYTIYPTSNRQPPPKTVELNLEGATTCRVKLVDKEGKPAAGVPVAPWLLLRPGKIDDANIGGSPQLRQITNEDGITMFRWFPADCERTIEFVVPDELHYIGRELVATRLNDEIETTVYKRLRVSGVVAHADGEPAGGVKLQGESRGGNYFRGYAKTNSKGEYYFDLYPDQVTSIEVIDNRWAATAQQVRLRPGQTKDNVDFKLINGGTLKGQITPKGGGEVAADVHVTIISSGRVVRWEYVDADGNYSARLAPGTYSLTLPGTSKSESVTIKPGDEIVRNSTLEAAEQMGEFTGIVVDPEGNPVAGAAVYGAGTDQFRTAYHGRTDANGRFHLERKGSTIFMCCHPTKPQAVLVAVPLKEPQHTFTLRESGSVTARLLTEDGKQPIANNRIWWRINQPGFQPFTARSRTDANGRFHFPAVPKGVSGTLTVIYQKIGNGPKETSMRLFLEVDKIALDKSELLDLGEYKVTGALDNRPKSRMD